MRRSTKQPGLAAAESSKPELQPPEKLVTGRENTACIQCLPFTFGFHANDGFGVFQFLLQNVDHFSRWRQNVQLPHARTHAHTHTRTHAQTHRRQLRSSDIATFVISTLVSAIRHSQLLEPSCGTAFRPRSNLRQSDLTLHQFHRALKTYLFGWLRLQHLVTSVFSVLYTCQPNSK